MNEALARAIADRLAGLPLTRPLDTIAGLVKTLETDAFSNGKKSESLPVPLALRSDSPDDWKVLLPDGDKSGIAFVEDGGFSGKSIAGLYQVKSRVSLIVWFNGKLLDGITREQLVPMILNRLVSGGRTIPTLEPGIARLQLVGWSNSISDPFTKYSAYQNLFNFKNAPYGYLSLDLSLSAYVDSTCFTL